MIVLDTSALMAIVLNEASADALADALQTDEPLTMSAATLAEALIVARRRGCGDAMVELVRDLGVSVTAVDASMSAAVADAYDHWGKGVHPAALTFGDCFAYALAKASGCPLLCVGEDFALTDVASALSRQA